GSSQRSLDRQNRVLRSMREFGVTGVIIAAVEDTMPQVVETLDAAGIAALSYSRMVPEGMVDYVGPDDVAGGRLATEHLLAHGVERLAYVGADRPSSASELRRQGALDALRAAGRPDALIEAATALSAEGGFQAGRELLARDEVPDGILCMSDIVAFGVHRALADAGVERVVRIIGFDDVELAAYWNPRLTTVSSHPAQMGRAAATALVSRLADREGPARAHFLDPELVIRESCGCAPTVTER
ncbi:MAG: substrate-binding domain-containing protein, partial [Microbacterium sp.]